MNQSFWRDSIRDQQAETSDRYDPGFMAQKMYGKRNVHRAQLDRTGIAARCFGEALERIEPRRWTGDSRAVEDQDVRIAFVPLREPLPDPGLSRRNPSENAAEPGGARTEKLSSKIGRASCRERV